MKERKESILRGKEFLSSWFALSLLVRLSTSYLFFLSLSHSLLFSMFYCCSLLCTNLWFGVKLNIPEYLKPDAETFSLSLFLSLLFFGEIERRKNEREQEEDKKSVAQEAEDSFKQDSVQVMKTSLSSFTLEKIEKSNFFPLRLFLTFFPLSLFLLGQLSVNCRFWRMYQTGDVFFIGNRKMRERERKKRVWGAVVFCPSKIVISEWNSTTCIFPLILHPSFPLILHPSCFSHSLPFIIIIFFFSLSLSLLSWGSQQKRPTHHLFNLSFREMVAFLLQILSMCICRTFYPRHPNREWKCFLSLPLIHSFSLFPLPLFLWPRFAEKTFFSIEKSERERGRSKLTGGLTP